VYLLYSLGVDSDCNLSLFILYRLCKSVGKIADFPTVLLPPCVGGL